MVYESDLDVLLQMYTQLTQYKCKYEKIVNQKVLCSLLLVDPYSMNQADCTVKPLI